MIVTALSASAGPLMTFRLPLAKNLLLSIGVQASASTADATMQKKVQI